jgi:hypothetical protein
MEDNWLYLRKKDRDAPRVNPNYACGKVFLAEQDMLASPVSVTFDKT